MTANEQSYAEAREGRAERTTRPPELSSWLRALFANWKLLAAGAVMGLGLAGAYLLTSPRQYASEALIAPSRSITQVQFEPKIQTVNDSSPQPGTSALTPERRQALVDLVRSTEIEQKVIQALQGQFPAEELRPGELIQRVRASLRPRSEILSIQAESTSPDAAVAVTNAWASEYVDQVNRIYASAGPDNSILALHDKAQRDLQQAQNALINSMRESRLEQLDSSIRDREHRMFLLQSAYQAGAYSQPDNSAAAQQQKAPQQTTSPNIPAGTRPPAATVDAATARGDYRLAEVRTLDDLAQTIRRLDATRENVRVLLSQADSGDSPSSGVALTLVKAQLVSISDGLPRQTQLQLPATNSGSADELRSLADNIDQVRDRVAAEFETRRATYEQNRDAQIAALDDELRTLRSQREQADAERKQLTLQRDVALDTYTALARKVEEQRIAQGAVGHEVELASRAAFAVSGGKNVVLTLTASFVLGALVVAAIVLLQLRPWLPREERVVVRPYHPLERRQARVIDN
ncbi:MAG TPA: Wzz/FepE/Etk N-terminal domain-containing protein [Chloroflexota bacterium]|nr:Wzz/FepE/Etk N-terminal domain-containing protein [Chloroflexota bacterium]